MDVATTAATVAAPLLGATEASASSSATAAATTTGTITAARDPLTMVWVTQGKTDHAAYILQEHSNGSKLIKWAANQSTEWVGANVEIKTELPKRRRGRRQPGDFVFSASVVSSKAETAAASAAVGNSAAVGSTAEKGVSKKRARANQGPKVKATRVTNKKGNRVVKNVKYPKGTKVFKVRATCATIFVLDLRKTILASFA